MSKPFVFTTTMTLIPPKRRPTLVVCVRVQRYDVLITRPTKWGNPYSHFQAEGVRYIVRDRVEAVRMYREWLLVQPHLMAALPEVQGRKLGCTCADDGPCHGHVIAELADALP